MIDARVNSLLERIGTWLGRRNVLALATVATLLMLGSWTMADADLWGHLQFGRDIVAARHVVRADSYSFTTDQPWINHEWASEVIMYGAYTAGGPFGLVLLKIAVVMAIFALIAGRHRREGWSVAGRCGLILLALAGLIVRMITVRPQLFSLLLFTILLFVLREVDRGARGWLRVVPAIFLVWGNLHGGWTVGMAVLIIWAGFDLTTARTIGERLKTAGLTATALTATLVNPYGTELWKFLWETVGLSRSDIAEWSGVWKSAPLFTSWVLVAGAGVFLLRHRRWRMPPSYIVITALLGALAFRVARLDAFFTLAAVLLLGSRPPASAQEEAPRVRIAKLQRFSQCLGRWCSALAGLWAGPPEGGHCSIVKSAVSDRRQILIAGIVNAVAGALILATGAELVVSNLECVRMEASWLPEAEAARFVRDASLRGRMLTWFDYGQYAIWYFAPALKVSMDGRRETVYSETVRAAHAGFYFNERDAGYARMVGADYIWLARQLPVVGQLERDGWVPVFAGPVSIIFAREPVKLPSEQLPATPSTRCFPGP